MFSVKESLAARLGTSLPPPAVALKALLLFFHLEAQLFFSRTSKTQFMSTYEMVPPEEALEAVLLASASAYAMVRDDEELVSLSDLAVDFNRILARDVAATAPHPPFRASIMDGYALRASDSQSKTPLKIVGESLAGDAKCAFVNRGEAAYVTTGAPVPEGADAVVRIEDVRVDEEKNTVTVLVPVAHGKWIRAIGSDIAEGEIVLKAGTVIAPADIGLLASIGVTNVPVRRRPVVGVLSTGTELVDASTSNARLPASSIRDSNRPMLIAAAAAAGADARDLGRVADAEEATEAAMREACSKCDVVITSGGVSMGSRDLVKPLLERIGTVAFGRVRLKPGKPTTFATVGKCLVFALPGNPVSAMVTFDLFVVPALRRMAGLAGAHAIVNARLPADRACDPVRREYVRASLDWRCGVGGAGEFVATTTGVQRSSRLLSMRGAKALLAIPRGNGTLPAGTVVRALLLGQSGVVGAEAGVPHIVPETIEAIVPPAQSSSPSASTKIPQAATCPCCARKAKSSAPAKDLPPPPHSGGERMPNARLIKIGVVTVSDRAHGGIYKDRSGPEVLRTIESLVASRWVAETRLVPDELRSIQGAIIDLVDRCRCDIVVTTGGTGPSLRDVTPEATTGVIERIFPGFGERMRAISLEHTPGAILSRQSAGMRGKSFVLNLPGNPLAIQQVLPSVLGMAGNAVAAAGGPRIVCGGEASYEIDAANVRGVESRPISETLALAEDADQGVLWRTPRGMGRKKRKVAAKLFLRAAQLRFLYRAMAKYDVPSIDKAIRIVLDWNDEMANAAVPPLQ